MKKIKRAAKRVLSLVLCLAMVATTVFFFNAGVVEPEAAVKEKSRVAFYVPEVIYLYPNADEWWDTTSTPFQYYVHNKRNVVGGFWEGATPKNSDDSEGEIIFSAEDGYSDSELTYRFLNLSFNEIEGGSVTHTKSTNLDAHSLDSAVDSGIKYDKFSVTAGRSPSLDASVYGCYLEWTLTYTNSDNERQSVIAYSYVYKPYTTPYGGYNRVTHQKGNGGQFHALSWVTGVHSVSDTLDTSATGSDGVYYPRFGIRSEADGGGQKSFVSFLSKNSRTYTGAAGTTYIGGIRAPSNHTTPNGVTFAQGVTDMYAVYATTNQTVPYFFANQDNGTFYAADHDAEQWLSKGSDSSRKKGTYGVRSFEHYYLQGSATGDHESSVLAVSAIGTLYIDTSRYDNLNQIPNLGVGLYLTRVGSADGESWYVADATGTTNKSMAGYHDEASRKSLYNDKITAMASYGDVTSNSSPSGAGLRYAGSWVSKIQNRDKDNSEYTYTVKSFYGINDWWDNGEKPDHDDYEYHDYRSGGHTYIDVNAVQTNKSALRTAVNNAIKSFGTLGVKDNFGSYYYDINSTAWQDFVGAFQNACAGLTKLDASYSSSQMQVLINNLNNTINTLKSGVGRRYYFDVNHDNIGVNLYVYQENGSNVSGINTTYNVAKEAIVLNGTLVGDARISYTPFTPGVGDYYYTAEIVDGKATDGDDDVLDGEVTDGTNDKKGTDVVMPVVESFNADITTRPATVTKLDQIPSLGLSRKDVGVPSAGTVNYDKTHANYTDLTGFWLYRHTADDSYEDFSVRIKIEKGNSKTEYSPAGRVSEAGKYNDITTIIPERAGYVFGGWNTEADGTGDDVSKRNADGTYSYNTNVAITSDILYAKWLPREVMLGNEFDFDKLVEVRNAVSNVNYDNNTFEMEFAAGAQEGNSAWYTIEVQPNHTYKIMWDVEELSGNAKTQVFTYFRETADEVRDTSYADRFTASSSVEITQNPFTAEFVFTIPDNKYYVDIRLDLDNYGSSGIWDQASAKARFSKIYVCDVTACDAELNETIYRPDPLFLTDPIDNTVTGLLTGPEAYRDGYEFAGWSTKKDPETGLGDPDYLQDSVTPTDGNTTVYATWTSGKYTIEFDPNGGSGAKYTQEVTYDEHTPLVPNNNRFTMENKYLVNWNTKADGSGTTIEDGGDAYKLAKSGTVTLYAQWSAKLELMFGNVFDFDKLYGNNTDNDLTVNILENTLQMSVKPDTQDCEDYPSAVGAMKLVKGHTYKVVYDYTPVKDKSRGQYHIWFSNNPDTYEDTYATYLGGPASIQATQKDDEGNLTYVEYTQPHRHESTFVAKDNYAFIRFDFEAMGDYTVKNVIGSDGLYHDKHFNVNETTGKYSNIYIYDITNYAENPDNLSVPSVLSLQGAPNEKFLAELFPEVTRKGYTHLGWSETLDSEGFGQAPAATEIYLNASGSKTVYPVFEANTYTIHYDWNRQLETDKMSGTMEDQVMTYDVPAKLLNCGFDNDEYVFWGWALNKEGTGTIYKNGVEVVNLAESGTITLYAVWKFNSEVIFGNMLDFDTDFFHASLASNVVFDEVGNSFVVIEDGSAVSPAASSGNETYLSEFGPYKDLFEPGKYYAIYYEFEVEEGSAGTQVHLWFADTDNGGKFETPATQAWAEGIYEPNVSSDITKPIKDGGRKIRVWHTFMMPEGKPDIQIRFDVDRAEGCTNAKAKFSNFYFYSITNPAGNKDDLNVPVMEDTGEVRINLNGRPNTLVDVNEFPVQSREGYQFVGWSESVLPDGNGNIQDLVTEETDLKFSKMGHIQLYSVWTPNPYTIKFDPNGGRAVDGIGFADITDAHFDEYMMIPRNNDTYVRDNAIFSGWNTEADGSGESYADGAADIVNVTSEWFGTGVLYAQWEGLSEVILGNYFDFDKYIWETSSKKPYKMSIRRDTVDNKLTLVTDDSIDVNECYTSTIESNIQDGRMKVVPGRTYRISFKAFNHSDVDAPVRIVALPFMNAQQSSWVETNTFNHKVTVKANSGDMVPAANKELYFDITIPEKYNFLTIRVGLQGANADAIKNMRVDIYDICVRDVTNFATVLETDDVSMPSQLSLKLPTIENTNTPNSSFVFDDFGMLTRTGYTFLGWSTELGEDGNGVLEDGKKVERYQFAEIDAALNLNVQLYPIWAPRVVLVKYKLNLVAIPDPVDGQVYEYGISQMPIEVENPVFTIKYFDGEDYLMDQTVPVELDSWEGESPVGEKLSYKGGEIITTPNNVIGDGYLVDDSITETMLSAKWINRGTAVRLKFTDKPNYILLGWSANEDLTGDVLRANTVITPDKDDLKFYAVWRTLEDVADEVSGYDDEYSEELDVVSGILINPEGSTEPYLPIKAKGHTKYDRTEINAALNNYNEKLNNFNNSVVAGTLTPEINNALLDSITGVKDASELPKTLTGLITNYLSEFTIKYAEGATGELKEGTHKVADVNLNHYSLENLKTALNAKNGGKAAKTQDAINKNVIDLATALSKVEDVKKSAPVFQVYDTAKSIKNSGLTASTDIKAMNYVFAGKGNYTYYCYTNSTKPVMYITVDEVNDGRICYPTKSNTVGDVVSTKKAQTDMPKHTFVTDESVKERYKAYIDAGIGSTYGAGYYSQKAVIELRPDFSNADSKATVSYTLQAYDDAYTGIDGINYADTSKLASSEETGKGTQQQIPAVTQREANTITIIIDYHPGEGFDVTSEQTPDDKWLKQFHLYRASGGASNWDLPMPGDTTYIVDDPTFGQTDYGSFTYTFKYDEAATNDFDNCILNSTDPNVVKEIVKDNYSSVKAIKFTGARNGGIGLGYQAWPNTQWSYNYYPLSRSYTYVHLVDRWGNVVDKVIPVPDVDAIQAGMTTSSAGQVEVIESGGSGIDTMSFSAQSFEIIADENSRVDGSTYSTNGNTITLYTGEANKSYTLTANDVATNKTTGNVKTDAEGYLTITVEDTEFDTASGMYTFTLNDKTINLYADVEDNIISATGDSVEAGKTATVQIITTEKVTMVQLVTDTGETKTATEFEVNEDGQRVWYIDRTLNAGEYECKVRAKVAGKWVYEGDNVTISVSEPVIFVGAVTSVEYTPSTDTRNEFRFTVTGRPEKIQVIEPDGGTRTYDRYHSKVMAIESYDEAGNVVESMSRELSYEEWTIEMNVPAGKELTAIARYSKLWSTDAPYKYTVELAEAEFDDEVYSMELAATEGWQGKVGATVVTGVDVTGVQFVMDNGTTATYYKATEADGKLVYAGNAWMNHEGENVIIVKIRVNNKWLTVGDLNYFAF